MKSLAHIQLITAALLALLPDTATCFSARLIHKPLAFRLNRLQSSFIGYGDEYSSDSEDFEDDDVDTRNFGGRRYREEEDDVPTVELKPLPLSKNAGNRFVAFVWDREIDTKNRDALELHNDRIEVVEDHVMFCRKNNLYNETFNTESMTDILWSLPILSSDLRRVIGHAMCLESTELAYARDLLARDPFVQSLTGGDLTNIPFYRWRHIRDYSLRIDDGRFGFPCMCLAIDEEPELAGNVRQENWPATLEYMIRSERVIATGPLHLPTELKNDPSSLAVGDLILFNAKDRDDAIGFVENLPFAQEGLYKSMRVHFYNTLDITGKFVSDNPLRDAPGQEMKEALEYWGYPTSDDQTPWLNW